MAGNADEISSELPNRNRKSVHAGKQPKSWPEEVRAFVVARKRVMIEEPRDAGKWRREGTNN